MSRKSGRSVKNPITAISNVVFVAMEFVARIRSNSVGPRIALTSTSPIVTSKATAVIVYIRE